MAGARAPVRESGSSGVRAEFFVETRPSREFRGEGRSPLCAGFVLSAVGSLTRVALRLANQKDTHVMEGHFEMVSLTGTTGPDGLHLHMAVSDEKGVTTGGHVVEGCVVSTTVELVLGEVTGLVFHRETDPLTAFKELSIQRT